MNQGVFRSDDVNPDDASDSIANDRSIVSFGEIGPTAAGGNCPARYQESSASMSGLSRLLVHLFSGDFTNGLVDTVVMCLRSVCHMAPFQKRSTTGAAKKRTLSTVAWAVVPLLHRAQLQWFLIMAGIIIVNLSVRVPQYLTTVVTLLYISRRWSMVTRQKLLPNSIALALADIGVLWAA